jgi:hypothetical protein
MLCSRKTGVSERRKNEMVARKREKEKRKEETKKKAKKGMAVDV